MRIVTGMLLTLLGVVVAIAGCGPVGVDAGGGQPDGGDQEATAVEASDADADIVITAEDMAYVDPPAELSAGTHTVALDNQGSSHHDLVVEETDETVLSAAGGETAVGEVTLEPGTYTFYCSVPGHRSAGMEFEVTVQ